MMLASFFLGAAYAGECPYCPSFAKTAGGNFVKDTECRVSEAECDCDGQSCPKDYFCDLSKPLGKRCFANVLLVDDAQAAYAHHGASDTPIMPYCFSDTVTASYISIHDQTVDVGYDANGVLVGNIDSIRKNHTESVDVFNTTNAIRHYLHNTTLIYGSDGTATSNTATTSEHNFTITETDRGFDHCFCGAQVCHEGFFQGAKPYCTFKFQADPDLSDMGKYLEQNYACPGQHDCCTSYTIAGGEGFDADLMGTYKLKAGETEANRPVWVNDLGKKLFFDNDGSLQLTNGLWGLGADFASEYTIALNDKGPFPIFGYSGADNTIERNHDPMCPRPNADRTQLVVKVGSEWQNIPEFKIECGGTYKRLPKTDMMAIVFAILGGVVACMCCVSVCVYYFCWRSRNEDPAKNEKAQVVSGGQTV